MPSPWKCKFCGGGFASHAPSGDCPHIKVQPAKLTPRGFVTALDIAKRFEKEKMEHPSFKDSQIWQVVADHFTKEGKWFQAGLTGLKAKEERARGNPFNRRKSAGWVLPDGKILYCSPYAHSRLLESLGKGKEASELKWIRFTHTENYLETHMYINLYMPREEASSAQWQSLERLIKDHDQDVEVEFHSEYIEEGISRHGVGFWQTIWGFEFEDSGMSLKEYLEKEGWLENPPRRAHMAKHPGKDTFPPSAEGCWFDSHRGVYIGRDVQLLASEKGWKGPTANVDSEDYCEAWEEAEQYLGKFAPEGYWIGGNENGDFGMWKVSPEDNPCRRNPSYLQRISKLRQYYEAQSVESLRAKKAELEGMKGRDLDLAALMAIREVLEKKETAGNPYRKSPYKEGHSVSHDGTYERTTLVPGLGKRLTVMGSKTGRSAPLHMLGKYKKLVVKQTNPPGSTLIGRKVICIDTSKGKLKGNFGSAYGMPNGTAYIKGFFPSMPEGNITAIEYLDEGKAKRMGLSPEDRPWRHDFSGLHVKAMRCKGGILLKGDKPVWEMR